MATKKTKTQNTALVKYNEKLAELARRAVEAEKRNVGGLPSITFRGSTMMVDDVAVQGNELDVVILTAVHANEYYDRPYDSDDKGPPVCYAFGDPESADPEPDMAPHEEAEEPQADACASCPMNQFGSAASGRGKACKNSRRLAVIPADSLKNVANAEVRRLTISPTNLKGWGAYVRMLANTYELPPMGVVTKIKSIPDARSQYKLIFTVEREVDMEKVYEALDAKITEANEMLTAPFPKMEEAPKKTKGRGSKVAAARTKAAPAKAAPKARRASGSKF